MKRIFLSLLMAVSAPAAAEPAASPTLPAWMAGMWHSEDGTDWADEMWSVPRAGLMQGMGRAGAAERLQSWEAMRIAVKPDGKISFFAQPRGAPASEFPMVSVSEEAIEFANAAHDYPQRIRYSLQGRLLIAEISKIDGSKPQRWNFRPAAGCP